MDSAERNELDRLVFPFEGHPAAILSLQKVLLRLDELVDRARTPQQ